MIRSTREAALALAGKVLDYSSDDEEQRLSLLYSMALRRGINEEKIRGI